MRIYICDKCGEVGQPGEGSECPGPRGGYDGMAPIYRPPWRERLRVWWANWKNRKVARAVRTVAKAMQEDGGLWITYHSNFACMIHDELVRDGFSDKGSWEISNLCASKIMEHFYNAPKK